MNEISFLESVVKMPLMSLPVRSTYIPVQNGAVLISPGSCLDLTQLKSLNSVTDLVAPNLLHCAGMQKAHSAYPNAKRWGALGVRGAKPQISWTDELSKENWAYQDELPMVQLQGIPKINEVVFFHKKSKSLIVTDLCFNMQDVKGIGPWIILNMFGTYKRFAVSKFFMRYTKDKAAFERSIGEIFAFDFENIILSHGANVIGNAKSKFSQALLERDIKPQ